MNRLAAFLGALIVVGTGLAVGAGIGGKGKTQVRTVVRASRTVTVTATLSPSSSSPSSSSPSSSSSSTPTPGTTPMPGTIYLSDEASQPTPSNADAPMPNSSEPLGGSPVPHAVAIPNMFSCENSVVVSYPTEGKQRFQATLGWSDKAVATADATLELRKDAADGQILWSRRFTGPGGVPANVALHGASTLYFVFGTPNPPCISDSRPTFVLGNARLSG